MRERTPSGKPSHGRRYAGPEAVDEFVRFADDALRLFVRVKPTRILALDAVGEH